MQQHVPIHDAVIGTMVRGRGHVDLLDPRGVFHIEHIRDGEVIAEFDVKNVVCNAAKNDLLNVYFNRTSTQAGWYIGLVDNSTFSSQSANDTSSSHSGWTEFTNYDIGSNTTHRGTWGQGSPSGQQITNSSPVVYNFDGSGTIWGIFVISDITKGGTIGILWSVAPFGAPIPVLINDNLRVTYTIQL
jgi:hypothetical protein